MKNLSEQDICTKFITPAIEKSGWDKITQLREQVFFTSGRITVQGKTVKRGDGKRADYVLYYDSNFPIAIIEAKDNNHADNSGKTPRYYQEIAINRTVKAVAQGQKRAC